MTLASTLAERGKRQLHVAETEKYAHVTYFFNGGEEDPYPGEERCLVDSPRDVPTYDKKPEMAARDAAEALVERWRDGDFTFGIINFANPDMVGHTGVIEAAVKAVETVDECLGEVVKAVHESGGVCIVTADHGNADHMLEPDGSPNTAHSMNPVPLVITGDVGELRDGGTLSDVAPTALALLGEEQPDAMTGRVTSAGNLTSSRLRFYSGAVDAHGTQTEVSSMALLMKPEPFSREIDRVFDAFFGQNEQQARRWVPPVDLVEAEDHFVLKADLPGLSEEDVSIEVQDGSLTISGERKAEHEERERGWYRIERAFGSFNRSLTLPDGVDAGPHRGVVLARRARGEDPEAGGAQAAPDRDLERRRQRQAGRGGGQREGDLIGGEPRPAHRA